MVRFRVDAATACRGSPVGVPRREEAIETALANKLADRAAKRELEAARAAKEIEEFSNEFLNAARKCFDLIDVDCSGTLTKAEMSARCVRRVWGGSYAIDATRRLPRDPPAASRPSRRTKPWCPSCGRAASRTSSSCSSRSASSARSRS